MQHQAIGLCGSLRSDSWNLKLLRNFLGSLEKAGFAPNLWPSLEMPLMNEDLEAKPLDSRITNFRAALKAAPVVVIASPEYNGSFSPALKNAIDWATRPPENIWAGKVVVLLGASPGGLGGVRGLIQLRTVLSGIKAWVIPEQVILPSAHQAFQGEALTNEMAQKQIQAAIESLSAFGKKVL